MPDYRAIQEHARAAFNLAHDEMNIMTAGTPLEDADRETADRWAELHDLMKLASIIIESAGRYALREQMTRA